MRLQNRRGFLLSLALASQVRPGLCQDAAAPPLPDAWELQVENLTRLGMRFWKVPGCAVAVIHDGKVILARGFGQTALEDGQPVTENTVFPIASITKSFTTTRLAQLVDAGKARWDDPLVKYLPWFRLSTPEATAALTLRQVASHTGGIASHDLLWYRWEGSMRQRVERLAKLPIQSKPGEQFAYQTSLFTALGLVEEALDSHPWDHQIQTDLLTPLGMKSTWANPADIPNNMVRAMPHRLNAYDDPAPCDPYLFEGTDPAGSIHSTASDMARWVAFHLSNGTLPDGKKLISTEQLNLLHTQQVAQNFTPALRGLNPSSKAMGYALGFTTYDHRGVKVVAHGGAVDGMRAQITFIPGKKIGFVVLGNLSLTRMNLALTHHLVDLFLGNTGRDYNGLVLKQQVKNLTSIIERANEVAQGARARELTDDFRIFQGAYLHPAYGEARLLLKNGIPVFKLGGTETGLRPLAPGCWIAQADAFGGSVLEYIPGDPPTLKISGEIDLTLEKKR